MQPFTLVIFGVTGNLAQIKLIPALYDLAKNGLLPENTRIIGIGRKQFSAEQFQHYFSEVLKQDNPHHQHEIEQSIEKELLKKISYISGNFTEEDVYEKLNKTLTGNKIFYLATYPSLYETIFEQLRLHNLHDQQKCWTRVVIEKPIGTDYQSSKKINDLLLDYFVEDQIYRLDHYLGKETLQNIINFRFGNGIFENLFNKEHIAQIQVTAAEDFGIGQRGGYYDAVGALRDVGQNHLLQMIALATMDSPVDYSNQAVTQERIKVLESLKPMPETLVLGQYEGYRHEPNVASDSQIDTFFAFETRLQTERFAGVPIFVRGGKKLARTVTEIALIFKLPQNRLFRELDCGNEPNMLVFRIQPNEGIVFRILTKVPGHAQAMQPSYMQFCYRHLKSQLTDPYERLLADVVRGDQTFFNDAPEVEAQWKFIDALAERQPQPSSYQSGSWGPAAADKLVAKEHFSWYEPSSEFCQF